jgi:hypothetical protein
MGMPPWNLTEPAGRQSLRNMKTTTTFTTTVPAALERLQALLDSDDAKDEKKKDSDETEQEEAIDLLTTIRDWSKNSYRRREIVHEGGIAVMVQALLLLSDAAEPVVLVLQSLTYLADTEKSRMQVERCGVLPVVADLLGEANQSSEEAQEVAVASWSLLRRLALSPACAKAMVANDVILLHLEPSLQHSQVAVAAEAASSLSNLAGHVNLHSLLVDRLPALTMALQTHATQVAVQEAGCQVWWNLLAAVTRPDTKAGKESPPPVLQAWQDCNGFAQVQDALDTHMSHVAVAEAACGALACGITTDAQALAAVPIVMRVVSLHVAPMQPAILTTAYRALATILRDRKRLQQDVLSGDLVLLLQQVAQQQVEAADQASLATALCEVWSVLATNHGQVTHLVQAQVVETLRDFLQIYADQAVVMDAASLVLYLVSQHYGRYVGACEGLSEAVEAALDNHGETQIRYGARLQSRLSWKARFGRR